MLSKTARNCVNFGAAAGCDISAGKLQAPNKNRRPLPRHVEDSERLLLLLKAVTAVYSVKRDILRNFW